MCRATLQARKKRESELYLLNRDQLLLFQRELRASQAAEALKDLGLHQKETHSQKKNGAERHQGVILIV
jgi:hypothetical protein